MRPRWEIRNSRTAPGQSRSKAATTTLRVGKVQHFFNGFRVLLRNRLGCVFDNEKLAVYRATPAFLSWLEPALQKLSKSGLRIDANVPKRPDLDLDLDLRNFKYLRLG
jgi:hypothetical protein